MRASFLRPFFAFLPVTFAATFGCAASPPDDAVEGRGDGVTAVTESRVKEQLIGNCWVYTTLGWVESLHLAHTHEELNLSESYVTYLHWFERITTGRFLFDADGAFQTADYFGHGAELVAGYGLVDEAMFVPSEANLDRSKRQEKALAAVEAALKPGGALATPAARKDPAKVRAVLDAAFALTPEVRDAMTSAFGPDLAKTRGHGAVLGPMFRDPKAMIVAKAKTGEAITLDDAIGELDPTREVTSTQDHSDHRGTWAWQRVPFGKAAGAARDAAVLRMKKALNAGFPVPIDWYYAYASVRDADTSFHEPVDLSRGGGWHASLVHDYQITVPGAGTLPVGKPVTDPALLAKTLAPGATIDLLRFKNSWGREVGPQTARGYTDATWAYLTMSFTRPALDFQGASESGPAVDDLVVPPASWDDATH